MCKYLYLLCFFVLPAHADEGDDDPEPAVEPAAEADFDGLLAEQNEVEAAEAEGFSDLLAAAADARVELPLDRVVASRSALAAQAEARARRIGPAVVLGEARYRGDAIPGALSLTADLQVTLGRPDTWKTVPLVGEDVVLVSARVEGRPVPVARRSGYHVWLTQRTGTVSVELALLVPARGPRGALEYTFTITRTPVTLFDCTFPDAALAPRIDGAVQTDITSESGRTRVTATLSPGLQVRLVGLKALADVEAPAARTYVEGEGLLVLGTHEDLFMALHYTILHGGVSRFPVRLPPGYRVESVAAGPDFHHTIQGDAAGDLLQGEVRNPVHKAFDLVLHLRRALPTDGVVKVAVPRAVGAERQAGWLAVEVPGKLRLDTPHHTGISAADVRRLPAELRESAVSPILQAWRHEAPDFDLTVAVQRLEERRVVPGVIDEMVAFTVVGETGARLTEVRLLFKNRVRHRLAMRLPPGAQLRSALLDGNPVSASSVEDGRVLLPLIRSGGEDDDFELSVVFEESGPEPALLGRHDLALPALELPVSTLRWSVFLPPRDHYSALEGEVAEQQRVGSVRWWRSFEAPVEGAETPPVRTHLSAAGTLPVRINLPRTGHRMNYYRAWVAADHPVTVRVWHARGWLIYPLCLGLALVLVGLLQRRWMRIPAVGAGAALWALAGVVPLLGALGLGLGLVVWRRRGWVGLRPRLLAWVRAQRARLRNQGPRPRNPWSFRRVAHLVLRGGVALIVLYLGQAVIRAAAPLLWSLWGSPG